jgi:hypothetical protein
MARTPVETEMPRTEVVDVSRNGVRPNEDHRRLKAQLHHQLVAGMDLSVLGTMDKEELRIEPTSSASAAPACSTVPNANALSTRSSTRPLAWGRSSP